MSVAVRIFDQTNAQAGEPAITLQLATERVTARELIERRVKAEVERYNQERPEIYRGLVQPTGAERVLNGFRLKKRRELSWKDQAKAATKAFRAGSIYLLFDDRQIDDLDEDLVLTGDNEVIFLKLVPLVGG